MGFKTPRVVKTLLRGLTSSCAGMTQRSNHRIGRLGFMRTMVRPPRMRALASSGKWVLWPAPIRRSGCGRRCVRKGCPNTAPKECKLPDTAVISRCFIGSNRPNARKSPWLWFSCPRLPSRKRHTTIGWIVTRLPSSSFYGPRSREII